ncbi:MAG: 3-phosphoshikimate 1-carboxyvinyltransferase [Eubacteriales bacterium]
MNVTINRGKAKGTIVAPPSKSVAHRMLICGGLANAKSTITGINNSEDVQATLDCLAAIGVQYNHTGDVLEITGREVKKNKQIQEFYCRESGSTLRFFIPLALLTGKKSIFYGTLTLLSRPLSVYQSICKEQDLMFVKEKDRIILEGPLRAGNFKVQGNISSQFISGLLFALPVLKKDSQISITQPIESHSYIDLTLNVMKKFGMKIEWKNERTLYIPGGQKYSPVVDSVEGDYSNAAFFSALNLLGGDVKIKGLDENSVQGDRIYSKYFEMIKKGTPSINISDCPDLGPILFALAAANNGGIFTGTRRLQMKESARAEAMAEELRKFGVSVTVNEDDVVVFPKEFHKPREVLNGHGDHRVVMALSTLATVFGGEIEGAEAVNKSFPDYFEKLRSVGIEVIKH